MTETPHNGHYGVRHSAQQIYKSKFDNVFAVGLPGDVLLPPLQMRDSGNLFQGLLCGDRLGGSRDTTIIF